MFFACTFKEQVQPFLFTITRCLSPITRLMFPITRCSSNASQSRRFIIYKSNLANHQSLLPSAHHPVKQSFVHSISVPSRAGRFALVSRYSLSLSHLFSLTSNSFFQPCPPSQLTSSASPRSLLASAPTASSPASLVRTM